MSFITDIAYTQASIAFRPSSVRNLGVVGLSLVSVDYGQFIRTVRAGNEDGFIETGTYSPTAMAVGLGYARSFGDRFSAGGNIKLVFQDFGTGLRPLRILRQGLSKRLKTTISVRSRLISGWCMQPDLKAL